ncbi:uncharacterized protein [Parasteatoda tepidariorum]|uniref:uncharacterized protein n=1 Tax=Parasteatoda tepidariorum TaxID=114398 RepID=UPI0039BC3567
MDGIDWVQPVPEEIKDNWNCWYNQLQGLCEVNIPRWIRGSAYRWKTFVKNRVSEIKECTSPEMWYHCPGSDNPDDKITHGVKIKDLVYDSMWVYGSSWLSESEENLPDKNSFEIALLSSCNEERCDMTPVVKNCEIQPILCISKSNVYEKCPIVLSNDYFAKLIVYDCHEKVLHNGVNETLSKEIISPLPIDRVEKSQPFEITGIDFAGPLYLKDNSKVYISLFACAVTRNIHLDLISNLSTKCFLLSLGRFFARRDISKVIHSDNAKAFKSADKELKYLYKLCKNDKVCNFLEKHQIEWKFIVEGAPWWGGFGERLVRSVKNCLKKFWVYMKRFLLRENKPYFVIGDVLYVIQRPIVAVKTPLNRLNSRVVQLAYDFTRGRMIGKLEEGRSVTSVDEELGINKSGFSRAWNAFKTTGTAVRKVGEGRPRKTTPRDDCYIVLQEKRNRQRSPYLSNCAQPQDDKYQDLQRPDASTKVAYLLDVLNAAYL